MKFGVATDNACCSRLMMALRTRTLVARSIDAVERLTSLLWLNRAKGGGYLRHMGDSARKPLQLVRD